MVEVLQRAFTGTIVYYSDNDGFYSYDKHFPGQWRQYPYPDGKPATEAMIRLFNQAVKGHANTINL